MIPKKRAWLYIFLSLLISSSLCVAAFSLFRFVRNRHLNDPKFRIVAVAQTNLDGGEPLKTASVAEILGLSVDRPTSLLRFSSNKAEKRLGAHPLIKEAYVKKVKPGTVSVTYRLRKPIGFLGDYSNVAMDQEGMLFPFHPFFTPKNLPEFILGSFSFPENQPLWGQTVKGAKVELALDIVTYLKELFHDEAITIRRIDVSKAYALSYGQRQVVVVLEEKFPAQTSILRLGSANWILGLNRYLKVRAYLAKDETKSPLVIDLRVPRQALYYFSG